MKCPEEERLPQEHVLDWASGQTFSGVVSDVSATGHSGECAAYAGPQAMARTSIYRRIFTCNICILDCLPDYNYPGHLPSRWSRQLGSGLEYGRVALASVCSGFLALPM